MKIFADWGTSNLRAWRVDASGRVFRRHTSAMGLRAAAPRGFAAVFDEVVRELGADLETPALIFGMAGSQKGWLEVPYTPTPADAAAIASRAMRIPDRPHARIIGGVCAGFGAGRPEVMRGEEVQAIGVCQSHPDARWLCLPGTHTKWVRVDGGAITRFTTFMTGELFDWVTNQSIISTQIEGEGFDPEGFEAGCALAHEQGAFTSALFQLRTRYLAGSINAEQVRSVASGLLIGHELASVRSQVTGTVTICAAPQLAEPYRIACAWVGLESQIIDPERSAIAGLLTLSSLIADGTDA